MKTTNISIKNGTREGSCKWFADQEWTMTRETYNQLYADVVRIYNERYQIVMQESERNHYWHIIDELSCTVGEALDDDLCELVTDDFAASITTDNEPIKITTTNA